MFPFSDNNRRYYLAKVKCPNTFTTLKRLYIHRYTSGRILVHIYIHLHSHTQTDTHFMCLLIATYIHEANHLRCNLFDARFYCIWHNSIGHLPLPFFIQMSHRTRFTLIHLSNVYICSDSWNRQQQQLMRMWIPLC